MTFTLSPWCTADGAMRETKLVVRKDIGDDDFASFRNRLPAYRVVTLEVGLLEHSDFDALRRPQALLHEIVGASHRRELLQRAKALKQPFITQAAQFGAFTLDRSVGWHEAQTQWGGCPVRLSLKAEDEEDEEAFPQQSLSQALRLWSEVPRWNRDLRAAIIQELLELKNNTWRQYGEEALTEDGFWNQLTLESITVRDDGSFEFWFDDGGTFRGHAIAASGSLDEGIQEVGLNG